MNTASMNFGPPLTDVNVEQATRLAETFRLMGDPSRLRIILVCAAAPTSVNDIADRLGIAQSSVSHHLRLLRSARLVRAERRGKQVFYCLADSHVHSVIADMLEHVMEPREPI
ncbi:MAG: DNA-binding transcriptional ArsR family regulator [Gammaproteobacteria bacterium]|jgi:DNA-binding transcriptional ArsR family regulator